MEEYGIMEYLELTVTIDAGRGGGRETENLFGVALRKGQMLLPLPVFLPLAEYFKKL